MVTRKFTYLLCLVILLWLTACEPSPEVENVLSVQLGQPFTITVNQIAQLTEKDLSLRFQEVLEDSRCPSNVECAEAGQARILIHVSQVGQSPATLELNTNPPLKQDVVTYADIQIRLLELNPYPEDIDQQIPEDAYQATLVITEALPQLLSGPGTQSCGSILSRRLVGNR